MGWFNIPATAELSDGGGGIMGDGVGMIEGGCGTIEGGCGMLEGEGVSVGPAVSAVATYDVRLAMGGIYEFCGAYCPKDPGA